MLCFRGPCWSGETWQNALLFFQLGWMGSWKQSSQICGQQPCKAKRASKGQSVSEDVVGCDIILTKPNVERLHECHHRQLSSEKCYNTMTMAWLKWISIACNLKSPALTTVVHHTPWQKQWQQDDLLLRSYLWSSLGLYKAEASGYTTKMRSSVNCVCVCVFPPHRDHYVEGKMRGAAPSKKIAAVQQKNVDLWVSVSIWFPALLSLKHMLVLQFIAFSIQFTHSNVVLFII